jgi:hypothetical protein
MCWTCSKKVLAKDRKIFESKPDGSRRGRPGLRMLKDVEKDLRELKFRKWRRKEGSP